MYNFIRLVHHKLFVQQKAKRKCKRIKHLQYELQYKVFGSANFKEIIAYICLFCKISKEAFEKLFTQT